MTLLKQASEYQNYAAIYLKAEVISEVCKTLTSAVVKPESLVLLPEVISFLCLNKQNLENFVDLMKSTVESLGRSLCKWAHSHLVILKEANERKMLNDLEFLELWNIKEENEVAFSRNLSLIKQGSVELKRSQSQTSEIFTHFGD